MIIVDGYQIDMSVKEDHEFPSEVTKLPIESGSDVSDHNREKNDELNIEGIVSDSPIGDIESVRNLDGASAKPSEEARAKFLLLRSTKKAVTVVTSSGVYESMALVNFKSSISKEAFGGLHFTLKFEKQRLVVVERVAVARLQPTGSGGNKPPKEVVLQSDWVTHDRYSDMWIDPALTVYVKGVGGVDVPHENPGGQLVKFNVWRRSCKYNEKTKKYETTKGPLKTGIMGTDDFLKDYVIKITPEQRRALIPNPGKADTTRNTKKDLAQREASRNEKLRVLPNGDVGVIDKADPRWKDSKPFVKK